MRRHLVLMSIIAVLASAVFVPSMASAKKVAPAPAPVPAPAPAPTPVNTGLLDVTNFSVTVGSSVNALTGVRTAREASAIAVVGTAQWTTFDEVFFNVRRVGGAWDRTLDFPYVATPLSFGGYSTIMLSTSRSYPAGSYEVRVAARQGVVMTYDEVIRTFTM